MKLSTRKHLLKDADQTLIEIRKNIRYGDRNTISEGVVSDFFINLVKSIVGSVSLWVRTKRQDYLYKKIPYLIGIDLINRRNLQLNVGKLKLLESLIKEITEDVRNSPKLKQSMLELEEADLQWMKWRQILDYYKDYPEMCNRSKSDKKLCKELQINLPKSKDNYYSILNNKIFNIIEGIITGDKYKSFEDRVISTLQLGIQGLTHEELKILKDNYLKIVAKRASEYVDKYDISHQLTSKEEFDYFSIGGPDSTTYNLPFGWQRSRFGKKGEP